MTTAESIQYRIFLRQKLNSLFKEIFRKSIHICSSLVPFFLFHSYVPTMVLLIAALCIYSCCEILRLKGVTIPFISKITEIAARKRDENRFVLGPVTLVLGILSSAFLFPIQFAQAGIFALAFGDGTASLAGKMFGKVTIPGSHGKTVAGSLTCFFAVFIATFCLSKNCMVSLITGTAAMFLEMLPLADFDNILIPILISYLYSFLYTIKF